MVEQLGRLRCLVALLATECLRRLDVSTMRAGAQLQRMQSRALRGGRPAFQIFLLTPPPQGRIVSLSVSYSCN